MRLRRRRRGRESASHGALGFVVLRSAEVLEALGAQINLSPAETGRRFENLGIGFMFARRITRR